MGSVGSEEGNVAEEVVRVEGMRAGQNVGGKKRGGHGAGRGTHGSVMRGRVRMRVWMSRVMRVESGAVAVEGGSVSLGVRMSSTLRLRVRGQMEGCSSAKHVVVFELARIEGTEVVGELSAA